MKKIIGLVALVALCVARPTSAAPITFTMSGPVLFSGNDGYAPVGAPASLSIKWEPNTPNSADCTTGRDGRYDAILDAVLSVGGHAVHFGGGAIEVNAPDGNCGTFESGVGFHMFGPHSPVPEDWLFWEILAFVGPANTHALTLAAILAEVKTGGVGVSGLNGGFYFNGPVVVTPEPGTLMLLGLGLVAARQARRRRRKEN